VNTLIAKSLLLKEFLPRIVLLNNLELVRNEIIYRNDGLWKICDDSHPRNVGDLYKRFRILRGVGIVVSRNGSFATKALGILCAMLNGVNFDVPPAQAFFEHSTYDAI